MAVWHCLIRLEYDRKRQIGNINMELYCHPSSAGWRCWNFYSSRHLLVLLQATQADAER